MGAVRGSWCLQVHLASAFARGVQRNVDAFRGAAVDSWFSRRRCTRFGGPACLNSGGFLMLLRFPSFRVGGFLFGIILTLPDFMFLDRFGDCSCTFGSADPPRSVPGLAWVIGSLICGTGHTV